MGAHFLCIILQKSALRKGLLKEESLFSFIEEYSNPFKRERGGVMADNDN